MKKYLAVIALLSLFISPLSPANAELHCKPCPYSCDTLRISKKHCDYRESRQPGFCCVDLDGKGMSQALLAEETMNTQAGWQQQSCPPGFSPSEQKCSPDERRHGCKDIRLNNGLGCVNRRR